MRAAKQESRQDSCATLPAARTLIFFTPYRRVATPSYESIRWYDAATCLGWRAFTKRPNMPCPLLLLGHQLSQAGEAMALQRWLRRGVSAPCRGVDAAFSSFLLQSAAGGGVMQAVLRCAAVTPADKVISLMPSAFVCATCFRHCDYV